MDQQDQQCLAGGEPIIFEAWEFTNNGQGAFSGRLITESPNYYDTQALITDSVDRKLANLKISEETMRQHPEGRSLVEKLQQLEKTRRLCGLMTGSEFSPVSKPSRSRSGLGVTNLRAASATARREAFSESVSASLSKTEYVRVSNNADSTCPTLVITATPRERKVRWMAPTTSFNLSDVATSRMIARLENDHEFQEGVDLNSLTTTTSPATTVLINNSGDS